LGSTRMRDTAPARPATRPCWPLKAGTHATCSGGRKHEEAGPFSGKFRPPKFCSRRDATLSADSQMTQLAGVAPPLAVARLAASLTRRPSLTRRARSVRPPTRRVSEGGIVVSETTGLLASNSTSEGRFVLRAKKYDQPSSTGTKCDPRRENELLSRRESFSRRGGKRFPDRGHSSPMGLSRAPACSHRDQPSASFTLRTFPDPPDCGTNAGDRRPLVDRYPPCPADLTIKSCLRWSFSGIGTSTIS
jgi:hypothetical protein